MKVWGVSEYDIRQAAEAVGVVIFADWGGRGIDQDGRALNFRLALSTERQAEGYEYHEPGERKRLHPFRWQRCSASPLQGERRVSAVCWHGHYAFMRYLLALRPDARIKSAHADYRGLADFLVEAPSTGHHNVGSIMYPTYLKDACFCDEYENEYYGSAYLRSIDSAADKWADAMRSVA